MNTATKTGVDAAKTSSKRVVQKTAEATGIQLEIEQLKKELQQLNQKKKKTKIKQMKQKKFTYHQKKTASF